MSIMRLNSPLDVYPIGSIYMSVNSLSPAQLFGGTWERIAGKFLLGATDNSNNGAAQSAGNTGGVASVRLTARQSGLQQHSHYVYSHTHVVPQHGHEFTQPSVTGGGHGHTMTFSRVSNGTGTTGNGPNYTNAQVLTYNGSWTLFKPSTDSGGSHSHTVSGGAVIDADAFYTESGGGAYTQTTAAASALDEHDNMPPYLSVYIWKRTA